MLSEKKSKHSQTSYAHINPFFKKKREKKEQIKFFFTYTQQKQNK